MTRLAIDVALHRAVFALEAAFELGDRGVTTLSGKSGSGKTTLLRCIAGLERPDGGRIRWGDEAWFDASLPIDVPTHRRGVGFVMQDAHLFPHLSVRQNLEYGARRGGDRPGPTDLDRIAADLGLARLLDRGVTNLSGGERQRVAIGRALLGRPRLLLLDEPVSALDVVATADVLGALERVLESLPIPCLYVSHDLREAARLADRMLWLDAGRIAADGPVWQVLSDPRLPFAQEEDAESVVAGRVEAVDPSTGLARVGFDGGDLWIAAGEVAAGSKVRVQIRARDVSLALRRPEAISVLNILEARVLDVSEARNSPSQALVRMQVGGTLLLSRVTRRSAAELGLAPGVLVWALVKSAAITR
ncbi:MAG: molybdenum ABC transporter ATP-binding protein [Gammaproteobacteria bacterium]|nr:molybdenum ABC transporter ATP-binding protein [Gammaproteobacteria bacterium]